jgi:hypothetical protein
VEINYSFFSVGASPLFSGVCNVPLNVYDDIPMSNSKFIFKNISPLKYPTFFPLILIVYKYFPFSLGAQPMLA